MRYNKKLMIVVALLLLGVDALVERRGGRKERKGGRWELLYINFLSPSLYGFGGWVGRRGGKGTTKCSTLNARYLREIN